MNSVMLARTTSIALLLALAPAQQRVAAKTTQVGFDAAKVTLSLTAQGQPLSAILEALQKDHGVRVTVPGLQDRKVDAEFAGRPLLEALATLLGEGVPFQLDFGERDVVLPPVAGGQPMPVEPARAVPERTPGDLPVRPEAGVTIAPVAGRPLMPAVVVGNAVEGDGESLPTTQDADGGTHACLVVQVRKDLTASVERVFAADGPAVTNATLVGDWIWELSLRGEVIAVGNLADPLTLKSVCDERPLDPRKRMKVTQLDRAELVLPVDDRLLDPAQRAQASLRLLRVQDGLGLPAEFSLATFPAFAGKARELLTIRGEALAAAPTVRK